MSSESTGQIGLYREKGDVGEGTFKSRSAKQEIPHGPEYVGLNVLFYFRWYIICQVFSILGNYVIGITDSNMGGFVR